METDQSSFDMITHSQIGESYVEPTASQEGATEMKEEEMTFEDETSQ